MAPRIHAAAQTGASWDDDHINQAVLLAEQEAARRMRRHSLDRADREDLRQEILLAVLERAHRFDPSMATWAGFVTLLARHAAADWLRAERTHRAIITHTIDELSEPDVLIDDAASSQTDSVAEVRTELDAFLRDAPEAASRALHLIIAACGDVADAQRASGLAKSPFYRAVADLRLWLRASGLGLPPRCPGKNPGLDR